MYLTTRAFQFLYGVFLWNRLDYCTQIKFDRIPDSCHIFTFNSEYFFLLNVEQKNIYFWFFLMGKTK